MDYEKLTISRNISFIMGYSVSPLDIYQTEYHPNVIHFWQSAYQRLLYDNDIRMSIINNYSNITLNYYIKFVFNELKKVPFGVDIIY